MKFNYITIMVRDLDRSLNFYQDLISLKVVRRLNPPQGKIAFIANKQGDTMLELIQFDQAEKVAASGMVLSFVADQPLADLQKKAIMKEYETSDITAEPPKPAHFTITDPDGLFVEISEA